MHSVPWRKHFFVCLIQVDNREFLRLTVWLVRVDLGFGTFLAAKKYHKKLPTVGNFCELHQLTH
jgi:hypothetical protein